MSRIQSLIHVQCSKGGGSPFEATTRGAHVARATSNANRSLIPRQKSLARVCGRQISVNEIVNEDNSFDTG
jgi:hypothetical protein